MDRELPFVRGEESLYSSPIPARSHGIIFKEQTHRDEMSCAVVTRLPSCYREVRWPLCLVGSFRATLQAVACRDRRRRHLSTYRAVPRHRNVAALYQGCALQSSMSMSPPSAVAAVKREPNDCELPSQEEEVDRERERPLAIVPSVETRVGDPPPPPPPLPLVLLGRAGGGTSFSVVPRRGPSRLPESVGRRPAGPGEKGQGWPYAPQPWPGPGDSWAWRVGHRMQQGSDFWQDRYLYPPKAFCKESERNLEFASKKSLKDYLTRQYPDLNAEEFFESFQWKVPCIPGASGTAQRRSNVPARRERLHGAESSTAKRQKRKCKADNASCPLESQHTAEPVSICEICCAEADFCRVCKCIICCRIITPQDRDTNQIRCHQRSSGGGACSHAAHLDCALEAELAGVVKKSAIDMEYLCRRCDKRSDLRDLVTHLLESVGHTDSASFAVQLLERALKILQGTSHGGNGGRLLETLVDGTLRQIQDGVAVEEAFKSLAAQAAHHQNHARSLPMPGEGMHHSEASLDQWLHASNTPASLRTTAAPSSLTSPWEKGSPPAVSSGLSEGLSGPRAVDGSNEIAGEIVASGGAGLSEDGQLRETTDGPMHAADLGSAPGFQREYSMYGDSSDTLSEVDRVICEGNPSTQSSVSSRLIAGGEKHTIRDTCVAESGLVPSATFLLRSPEVGELGLPSAAGQLQLLEPKLNGQIHEALQKLKETQAAEYMNTQLRLHLKKEYILRNAQALEQELTKRASESLGEGETLFGDEPVFGNETETRVRKLQEAQEEFDIMLNVSKGLLNIPRDVLRKLFGWPPDTC